MSDRNIPNDLVDELNEASGDYSMWDKKLGFRTVQEIERMRGALVKSVEVIRQWHGMGVPKKQEQSLWDIYWRSAPEMKQIRDALTALLVSEKADG